MTVLWPNGSTDIPRVSSEFDAARCNPVTGIVQPHNGIDLVGWQDNKSPVDGVVIFAGYNGRAGNEVRIQGDDGNFYRILHNAWFHVSSGQRVSAGQAVGRMGTTGQSTGVHCHFETHYQRLWNYQNPRTFMSNANSGTSGGDSKPFGGFLMALNDQQQAELYNWMKDVQNRVRGPLEQPYDMLQVINEAAQDARARIRGPLDKPYDMLQDILGQAQAIRAQGGDVDEEALAKNLAPILGPILGPLLADQAGSFTDAQLKQIAEAVADVQAERLKS